jgi:hypothetical protein
VLTDFNSLEELSRKAEYLQGICAMGGFVVSHESAMNGVTEARRVLEDLRKQVPAGQKLTHESAVRLLQGSRQ